MAQKKKTNQKTKAKKPANSNAKKSLKQKADLSGDGFLKDEITILVALAICI